MNKNIYVVVDKFSNCRAYTNFNAAYNKAVEILIRPSNNNLTREEIKKTFSNSKQITLFSIFNNCNVIISKTSLNL